MTSVVCIGNKQFHVQLGSRLRVEKLPLEKGEVYLGDQVLAIENSDGSFLFGTPYLEKAQMKAKVVRHGRAKKVLIVKKKRRKGYRKTQGHRQHFTELHVEALSNVKGEWKTLSPKKKAATTKKATATKTATTAKTTTAKKTATKATTKATAQKKTAKTKE